LPNANKFYYAISTGSGNIINNALNLIYGVYYNNSNLLTDFPSNRYFYQSDNAFGSSFVFHSNSFINNAGISTLAQQQNRNYMELSGTGITTLFLATNISFENLNKIATFGSDFVVIPMVKGQIFLFDQFDATATAYPTTYFNCVYSANDLSICYAKLTTTANISGLSTGNFAGLVQMPTQLTFTSSFSYISPSGQIPACFLDYPLKPVLTINKESIPVTMSNIFNGIQSTKYPSEYQITYPASAQNNLNYGFLVNTNTILNNTDINVSGNSTYKVTSNSLTGFNMSFNKAIIGTNFLTIYNSTYTDALYNSTAIITGGLQLSNSKFTHYFTFKYLSNASTNQSFTTTYALSIPFSDLNLTGVGNNQLSTMFHIHNISFNLTNDGYLSANYSTGKITLVPRFTLSTNSVLVYFGLKVPSIVPAGEVNTTFNNMGITIDNVNVSYSIGSTAYTFSTLDTTPFNAIFNSSNPEITNPSNTEIYNETYFNSSTIPNLFWSYNLIGKVPVTITAYVNNIIFTPSTKFDIMNKNYTSSTNSLSLSLNASTIYTGLAYFIYNSKAKVVKFSFTTASFNPCLITQALTKVTINTTIYVNGSITTITKSNNQTTSNSSSITTTPTTPTTPISIFTPQQTFFGMSFLNLGSASWIATIGLLYLIGTFSIFLYLASKYKRTSQTLVSYVILGVLLVIGFGLGYVQPYLFALFMLLLLVVVADTFRTLLSTRKG
jgi:hypothetical protein